MSRRARLYEVARDAKRGEQCFDHGCNGCEDCIDDEDTGPLYSCPGCGKARGEPFHCTACNAHSEAPGWED